MVTNQLSAFERAPYKRLATLNLTPAIQSYILRSHGDPGPQGSSGRIIAPNLLPHRNEQIAGAFLNILGSSSIIQHHPNKIGKISRATSDQLFKSDRVTLEYSLVEGLLRPFVMHRATLLALPFLGAAAEPPVSPRRQVDGTL
jgi:hypothetical protein